VSGSAVIGPPGPAGLEAALLAREAWLERASRRWSALAHGAALAFLLMLYSNPQFWWPWFEKLRLAFVSAGVCAAAVVVHRLVSGERIRLGGWSAAPLWIYLAFIPASYAWTVSPHDTLFAIGEGWKMAVIYAAVQNVVDTRARLRRFMLVGALASIGPALGAIEVWRTDDALIEGFRTHWRGAYADPNRLAMAIIAVLPFALYGAVTARRRWARALFFGVVAAQLGAIVLTHSRSGSIAAGVAVLLFMARGRGGVARGVLSAVAVAVSLAAFAPDTFWQRSSTLAHLEEDESVQGRENAWKVLGVIVEERPLTGVGAGAFIQAWGRYAPLEAGARRYIAHNILLEIVGELGIIAFLLFCGFATALLLRLWRVGEDPLVGIEGRAVFAALAAYLVCEMANGYSLSWFLYFLFACAAALLRISGTRAALAREAP
jgi:putative inorganic carbon (hco3(-)) transporter